MLSYITRLAFTEQLRNAYANIATTTTVIIDTGIQLSEIVQTIEQAEEVLDDEVWVELEVVVEHKPTHVAVDVLDENA